MNEYKITYTIKHYVRTVVYPLNGDHAHLKHDFNITSIEEFEIIKAVSATEAIEIASGKCIDYNKYEEMRVMNRGVKPSTKCVKDIWRL